MRKLNILLILMVLVAAKNATVEAQQFPIYSQYMMNSFLLNPAVAGHEGYTAITNTERKQWIGLKDAPTTIALSAQTRLLKNSYIARNASIRRKRRSMSRSGKVGIGGYVFSDWNGAFNRTGAQFTYSYHITLRTSTLSYGVSLSAYQFKIDDDKIKLYAESDFYGDMKKSAIIPDANIGVYYSDKNMYAGISGMQLFQNTLKLTDKEGAGFKMVRHYFAMAGYRFEMMEDILLEPSFLLKTTEKFVSQLDVNLKTYIKENYWAGLSYRTGGSYSINEESLNGGGSSIIVMGGARFDKFFIGYALDLTLSAIGKYSFGSHELILALRFGDNARRYKWLNRY